MSRLDVGGGEIERVLSRSILRPHRFPISQFSDALTCDVLAPGHRAELRPDGRHGEEVTTLGLMWEILD